MKILSNGCKPIKPIKVTFDSDGKLVVTEGILSLFKNRILKVDKHKKKVTFEITVCGENKTIELSIDTEEKDFTS